MAILINVYIHLYIRFIFHIDESHIYGLSSDTPLTSQPDDSAFARLTTVFRDEAIALGIPGELGPRLVNHS